MKKKSLLYTVGWRENRSLERYSILARRARTADALAAYEARVSTDARAAASPPQWRTGRTRDLAQARRSERARRGRQQDTKARMRRCGRTRSCATALLTVGAVQSNDTRQTAAAAARVGVDCVLLHTNWVPQPSDPYRRVGNILLSDMLGACLYYDATERVVGDEG